MADKKSKKNFKELSYAELVAQQTEIHGFPIPDGNRPCR